MSHKLKKTTFSVIPDTNVLFPSDKSLLVSPVFERVLNECESLANLRLFFPQVVIQEREFRLAHYASQLLRKAKGDLETLSKITGIEVPTLASERKVKQLISRRFSEWCKSHGASTLPVPIKSINWQNVVHSAIWRIPPFEFEENSKTEKGFRDCLILETVREFAASSSNENIVFISSDGLLSRTVKTKLAGTISLLFKDIESFGSHLKLLDEQFESEFIAGILKQANDMFIQTLFAELKVEEVIKSKFSFHFLVPAERPVLGEIGNSGLPVFWSSTSALKPFIFETQFEKKIQEGVFQWNSRVELVQLYNRFPPLNVPFLDERIRISKFDVLWNINITPEGAFSNPILSDTKLIEGFLELAPDTIKIRYGFQELISSDSNKTPSIRPSMLFGSTATANANEFNVDDLMKMLSKQ